MWWRAEEVVQEGGVVLVRNVVLGGNVITEGCNRWRWTNGAVGSDCRMG